MTGKEVNKAVLAIFAVILLSINALGQAQAAAVSAGDGGANKPAGAAILPLNEVKTGMKGVARTVFQGTQSEEFNVEILGILPGGIGPKQDLIIGKLSGTNVARTSVFAGMSGSPVYVDGRLIGSISYSFPYSKEPICGITPIQQMISIFKQNQGTNTAATQARAFTMAELKGQPAVADTSKETFKAFLSAADTDSPLAPLMGQQFMPIATPLTFTGISQATLNQFAPQLMSVGLMPMMAAGGRADITPLVKANENTLQGGDSVTMQLARGDYSMAAAGTVTMRDGEQIYAFGHPFLSLGVTDLPMSESSVVTVVPSVNNSFKLAVPGAMVGSMKQDRATGVYGKIGQSPSMIPVKLRMQTSRNQIENYEFEIANDGFLTPILLNMTAFNSIVANEKSLGDATISVEGKINIKGQQPITIDRRFSSGNTAQFAAGSAALPMSLLLRSGFSDIDITGIELNITTTEGKKTAQLQRVTLDRTEVRPGETFEVQAFMRSEAGQIFVQKIPVKVPADIPAGALVVAVADGDSLDELSAAKSFVPKDVTELIKTINRVKKDDRLYVETYRITSGAVIGSNELPNLPPSVLATLNNDRSAGGFLPRVLTALSSQEFPASEYVVSGSQALTIQVVK
jgi:SpoIVB peptidase S55